jgi:hypothetical protein
MTNDGNREFEEDRAREILRRAIEIDSDEDRTVTDQDIRLIAAELDVKPASLDQAFGELGSELVARPSPPPPATRRWLPFTGVVAAGIGVIVIAPETTRDISIVAPYLLMLIASYFAASTSEMRIGEEGITYRGSKGRKVLKWDAIIEIKPFVPNAIHVVGASKTITVLLEDFGDPDAVLRIIKSRMKAAEQTSD